MELLERELETMIYDATLTEQGRENLWERGLTVRGKFFRQFNLGNYGILDLASIYYVGNIPGRGKEYAIDIYELKRGCIDANALMQGYRYKKGIYSHFLSKYPRLTFTVNIILIGNEFQVKGDFVYLYNETRTTDIYTFSFDLNGIQFLHVPKVLDIKDKGEPGKVIYDKSFVTEVFDKRHRRSIIPDNDFPF